MDENRQRDLIVRFGELMFSRGLTAGSSGNISVRLDDGWLVTPTNACLGLLDPAELSRLDVNGEHVSGDAPTKEQPLHLAMYRVRPEVNAVVHLHSTWSVAVSCLEDINSADVLPPLTAYYLMRIGSLPLVEWFPPGHPDLGAAVAGYAEKHHAVLLANHGPVVAARSLEAAVYATEELEETARLFMILKDQNYRPLTARQVDLVRASAAP